MTPFQGVSREIRDSLVARITACRAVDRGSIPRRGVIFYLYSTRIPGFLQVLTIKYTVYLIIRYTITRPALVCLSFIVSFISTLYIRSHFQSSSDDLVSIFGYFGLFFCWNWHRGFVNRFRHWVSH